MSTTKLQENANNCKFFSIDSESVIVKGFTSKPTMLDFCNYDDKCITVLCRDGETQMNFAIDVVCQYEPESYKMLRSAFENEDKEGLGKEWQKAKPTKST